MRRGELNRTICSWLTRVGFAAEWARPWDLMETELSEFCKGI